MGNTLQILWGYVQSIALITLMISIPIIALILILEFWEAYSKRKNFVKKEAERIILKFNDEVVEKTTSINTLDEIEKNKKANIFDLEQREKELSKELARKEALLTGKELPAETDEDDLKDNPIDEKIDLPSLTIKDLHAIGRALKITGFSRMKKNELIERFENIASDKIREILNNNNEV